MSKRSNFERIEKDAYQTIDPRAVKALLPYLPYSKQFIEPCCGDGLLVRDLVLAGHICMSATDIKTGTDALTLEPIPGIDSVITNPPWSRSILHPMIDHFMKLAPEVWLLFDADWMHTKQAIPYMEYCTDVVSIGRLIWIPNTTMQGKDNCCWYRFSLSRKTTEFHARKS